MRKLRQLSMVVVLMLTLTASAFAGIIGGGPAPSPPPPEPPSAPAMGITDTPPSGAVPVDSLTVPIVEITLNLLRSVLAF